MGGGGTQTSPGLLAAQCDERGASPLVLSFDRRRRNKVVNTLDSMACAGSSRDD
jgi:hypothetical protein